MPAKVYNNVEGHRLLDKIGDVSRVCEDVTQMTLPTLTHPTTSLENVAGMAMDVDMPNITHLEKAEFSIAHNNGINCQFLATPGKHFIEARVARQVYNTTKGVIEYESVKAFITCVHKETSKGNIETGNPYGSTEKYSVLAYEEVVNGETTVKVDAVAGILEFNGTDYYGDNIETLLS
ncbi:MAG: phage major tail tube protein [Lentisphaeria bacterium]|nr:phage major tail tube protein [Lentisphaeria bacterium]